MTRAPGRENWLAAGFLLILLAGVHYDVIFLGRSLVHSNLHNPADERPLARNYGDRMVPFETWTARNLWRSANIRDPGATWWQWEPGRVFLRQAMAEREWPFWDPYVAAGTPAMANLIPAFFFPPYTLVVWLGASVPLLNAYYLFLLWGAAFLTLLFLRRHELGVTASLTGAVLVLMSGALNQNLGSFMGQTACCLPLVFYATRMFLDRPTRRRGALMALAYSATALASFPPLLLAIFGLTTIYVVVAIAVGDSPRGRASTALGWSAATLLSVGLVSFYYGPALVLRQAVPHVAALYRGAGLETMPVLNALQLLSPTAYGGLQVYMFGPFTPVSGPHIPYVGWSAVLASLLARPLATPKLRTLFYASLIGAALIVMKLFGVPPVQWIGTLPFFDQIHYAHYFGVPLGFMLAFLAALGVEGVLRGTTPGWRIVLAAVVGVLAVEGVRSLAGRAVSLPVGADWLRDWKVLATVAVLSTTAVAMAALARGQARISRLAAASLLALSAAEGVYNNSYPSPAAWDIFDHPPPYLEMLRTEARGTRVFAVGAPTANTNEGFGVPILDSLMAFNPPRIFELYARYAKPPGGVFIREATVLPPEPVLDRAGVSFISVRDVFPAMIGAARERHYRSRFGDGYVSIFERPAPSRFAFSSEFRVMPREDALEAIGTAAPREVILESQPGVAASANAANDPTVIVETYGRNSATLIIDAPRPGLLYASESFFDGWRATLNGTAAPILPANYAFRAVAVPAGRSRVVFTYWPPGLTVGLWLSGLSAVIAGLALARRSAAPSLT